MDLTPVNMLQSDKPSNVAAGYSPARPEVHMFKSILVALDGSPTSNAGLKHAVQLASDQGARLVGLHVVDDAAITVNFEGGYVPAAYVDKLEESLRRNASSILAKAAAVAKAAGVEMKAIIAESHGRTIADAILAEARKSKADVIVIGTHGRRGISRILMGSDAEAVVREAGVPVLLVRTPEGARHGKATAGRRSPESSAGRRVPATKRATSPATVV
jgi:nucleotide-binding universal stress UspA family protein